MTGYDKGGLVAPGPTMVRNESGRAERVLPISRARAQRGQRRENGWVDGVKPQLTPDGETFRSVNEVAYHYNGTTYVIPPMQTDFASVPRLAVWLIPRFGKYTEAAFWHDWACEYGIRAGAITSRNTDLIFRQIMCALHVTFLMRWLMWTGVRWGAAVNPVRRRGWWRDLPAMLPFTILALPMLIPAAIGILWGLILFAVVQLPISLGLRGEATTAGVDATT